MAWACGPSGYGVPETPVAPPNSTAAPVVVAPAAPPAAAPAPAATPARNPVPSASSGSESGSATTKGADSSSGSGNSGSGGSDSNGPGSGSLGSSQGDFGGSSGPSAIEARIDGATAGIVRQGSQSVFKSSTAGKADSSPRAGAASATDDLWTAAPSPRANSSLASVAGGDSGGLSSAMVAGIIVLSLGLMGIIGGVLAAETRRRRAEGAGKH